MSENVTNLTNETFDTVIKNSTEPVVVDFWAEWCGPCKMVAPILDEIADENVGKIKVTKLNVDENQDIAMRYQVMSIPTMLVFENGEVTKSIVGAKAKAQIMADLGL